MVAIRKTRVFQFRNDFAAFFARIQFEIDLPLLFTASGALSAQFFQTAHTPLVARSSRLNALANPHFFLRVKFIKQAIVFRLNRQFLRFFLAVFAETALVRTQHAPIQFHNPIGDVVQKTAVVRNHHHAA